MYGLRKTKGLTIILFLLFVAEASFFRHPFFADEMTGGAYSFKTDLSAHTCAFACEKSEESFRGINLVESAFEIPASYQISGVPIILQIPGKPWCGPTCLTMILHYWGDDVDLWTVGTSIDPEENGAYDYELADYAEERDFTAIVFDDSDVYYRSSVLDELKIWVYHDYPVGVGTDYSLEDKTGHERIVIGYDESYVYMIDPNFGHYKVTYETFDKLWWNDLLVVLGDPSRDSDNDGLADIAEIQSGNLPYVNFHHITDIFNPDTDGDDLKDGEEVNLYHSNPLDYDTDNDDIGDGEEVETYHTDPNKSDTDNDNLSDYYEIFTSNTDPNKSDTDDDDISDYNELYLYGTNPLNPDSDDDGLNDGAEITHGTDPLISDSDGDGLTDGEEISLGANPLDSDTDDDLWNDSIDPMPTNFFVPNFIIISIAIGAIAVIVFVRRRRAKKEIASPSEAPSYYCPTCGTKLEYVEQTRRWYCPKCQKYQ